MFSPDPTITKLLAQYRKVPPQIFENSTVFSVHVLSVMGFVEKVTARLHEKSKIESLLLEVGDVLARIHSAAMPWYR